MMESLLAIPPHAAAIITLLCCAKLLGRSVR
jgi:hypothetical protein